jgi:gas vesicle protein
MTTTKLIVGILGAAAAGVVIGMLIAPEKGSDLRTNIKKTADDWIDEVSQWIGRGKEYIDQVKTRAGQEADELQANAEQGVNTMKESLARKRSSIT